MPSSTPYQLQSGNGGLWQSDPHAVNPTTADFEELLEDDHPEFYMSDHINNRMKHDSTLSEHDKMIIQRLACRKFFVPGHTFWQDYRFWFSNNHPILCFWLADPRHPLGRRERIVNLLASLAFGLAATCSVVLWFHYEENRNFDNLAFSIFGYYDITVGMLALLLFSGPLHVAFDLGIYFLQACPPCRVGGAFEKLFPPAFQRCWVWLGKHLASFVTAASLLLALYVMLLRASIQEDGVGDDIALDYTSYDFLVLYVAEVVLANFVVFPMGTFTMFSGVLGCGRLPGIGGRPFQVRKHESILARQAAKKKKSKPVLV